MVDHFEWTLSHAKGEWVMFLGADDGVQQYFFELADQLTSIARSMNIKTIASRRAYLYWPGCEDVYGGAGVSFSAEDVVEIKDFAWQTWRTLFGLQTYFELPQMYSNSLFKKELLIKAKTRQGRVFTSLTPDANLAAIACRLEKKYLLSGVPLGWIGSSPSSNGLSIAVYSEQREVNTLPAAAKSVAADFLALNAKSQITFNRLAGDILLGANQILFWESLLQTATLGKRFITKLINLRATKALIFSQIVPPEHLVHSSHDFKKARMIHDILSINHCSDWGINFAGIIVATFKNLLYLVDVLKSRAKRYRQRLGPSVRKRTNVHFNAKWAEIANPSLETFSEKVASLVYKAKLIQSVSDKHRCSYWDRSKQSAISF
jgi:hypothetical protein